MAPLVVLVCHSNKCVPPSLSRDSQCLSRVATMAHSTTESRVSRSEFMLDTALPSPWEIGLLGPTTVGLDGGVVGSVGQREGGREVMMI